MAAKSFWLDGVSATPPSFVLSANLVRVMLYVSILVINECINSTDTVVNQTCLQLGFVPLITTLWAWLGSLIHPISLAGFQAALQERVLSIVSKVK